MLEQLSFEIPRAIDGRINRYKLTDEMFEEICSLTPFVKDASRKSLSERVYCIVNNLSEFPKCSECGGVVKFSRSSSFKYREFCSVVCSSNSVKKKERIEQTCLEKYGASTPLQIEEFKEMGKRTKFERYGDENYNNPNKGKETKFERYGDPGFNNQDKAKQTSLERYGVEFFSQTDEFRDKLKQTCLEKYGVDHQWKCENVRDKIKQTSYERYGDENYNNIEQAKQTRFERYGDENYNNREQCIQTSIQIWGTPHHTQSKKFKLSMMEKGIWLSPDQKSDFEYYRSIVLIMTKKQALETLENFEKRGHPSKENAYNLDHKFSIAEGFAQNIPAHIIANINNLEMLTVNENCSKGKKCSTTIDEILSKIGL